MEEIEKAMDLKAELDLLRPIKNEDELRIMQKFRLDWNFHSNNIEGNSLTYGETKALILFGITAQGKPLKDHFEVTGHDEAVKWILDIVKEDRPLNENFIRELHKLILKEPYFVDAITPDGQPTQKKINISEYKTSPNHVKTKTGEIFRFATPQETPIQMAQLIDWYRAENQKPKPSPILLASQFHYKFIRIHPFDDGNGRTVRILMNFILLKFGYPPVIIKTEDKASYFSALQQADAGNLTSFVEYIAKNLNESLEIMIKGAKGESITDDDDIDKKVALLERKLQNIGNPISHSRSLEAKKEAHDLLIAPLVKKFIEKCSLFDRFYVNSKLSIETYSNAISYNKELIIEISKNILSDDTNFLTFDYDYIGFNQPSFNEESFRNRIFIKFELTRINISSLYGKKQYKKLYGQSFTEDEIREIVNAESERHAAHIEKLIEKKKTDQ